MSTTTLDGLGRYENQACSLLRGAHRSIMSELYIKNPLITEAEYLQGEIAANTHSKRFLSPMSGGHAIKFGEEMHTAEDAKSAESLSYRLGFTQACDRLTSLYTLMQDPT